MIRLVATIALVVACTPSAFGPTGYSQPDEQYRIRASSPKVLEGDWVLDSHHGDSPDKLKPKQSDKYLVVFPVDIDGDGDVDYEHEKPLYDLRWEHAKDSTSIWVRTIPIPSKLARKDERVLLLNYIERIAGSGLEFASYDGVVTAIASRYGTKVLGIRELEVGKQEAHVADVEIVNLDQLEADESAPRHRARLVLLHCPTPIKAVHQTELPAVILAGYSSRPEDFLKHVGEFEDLLSRLDLGNGPTAVSNTSPPPELKDVSTEAAESSLDGGT